MTTLINETKTTRGNIAALMVALLAACVAFQLNASMLSPALVTMGNELHTGQAVIGLSQTWFFTAAALFSLFLPRLSDIVGRKKILLGMMLLMALGSVIAAMAPDVTWLFVGRVVQGVSGPTVPLCLIMLRSAVNNPRKYGALMGLITAVNGGVAGVDSFVGGYFAEHFGFRSIFWLMVGLAVVATALIAFLAGESKPAAGTRMDWLGVVFIVIAVGALLTALNEGSKLVGAFSSGTLMLAIGLTVVAVVAFAAFWRTEKRSKQPMVETVHLRQRSTWAPLLTTTLAMTGIFAVINGIVPAYVQAAAPGFGVGPTEMSLMILTPYALLGWVFGPISGRLAPVLGYTKVLRIGMLGSIASLAVIAFLGLNSLPLMIAGTALLGIMYAGTVNIMLNGLGVVLSPAGNPGFLPGMNAGAFNLGAGLSFLVLPAVLVATSALGDAKASYLTVVVVGLAITVAAFAASLLIPKPLEAEVEK
ncbi:uridine transporter UriT [Arthrobacter bambusae]|uniref:uridine transporter UriT n=1 Tax=Arthrobacter bambusae TaxID=1338426 RepID=UPI00277D91DC|nr:MFS transporter [Arthrobacter bambusae]MDQ0031606.1 MFS family permease [Arthrobacter bambusae]MDQ0099830.1 MFS family permease [Arthrobacter bambusae]